MDPMQKLMLIAATALAIRIALAIIATRRGWGWWPWGILALELVIELAIPAIESMVSVTTLAVLVVLCVKKRKPKGKPIPFDTEVFWKTVDKTSKLYPMWRKGQTVFNVMLILYPDAANRYRATDIDPFYSDSNIECFVVACRDFMFEKEKTNGTS